MRHSLILTPAVLYLGVTMPAAQPKPIAEYLASMDGTEVSFAGRMVYNGTEDSFTFLDEEREQFPVTMDTGREARERVEISCQTDSFMYTYDNLCQASGTGTV